MEAQGGRNGKKKKKKHLFWISSYPDSVKLQVNGLECLSVISEELWKTGSMERLKVRKHCSRPSQPGPGPPSPGLWLQPSSLSSLVSAFCVPLHTPGPKDPDLGWELPPSWWKSCHCPALRHAGQVWLGSCRPLPTVGPVSPKACGPPGAACLPQGASQPHVGLGRCLGSQCWPRPASGATCSCSIGPRLWQLPTDPLPPPSDWALHVPLTHVGGGWRSPALAALEGRKLSWPWWACHACPNKSNSNLKKKKEKKERKKTLL